MGVGEIGVGEMELTRPRLLRGMLSYMEPVFFAIDIGNPER